MVRIGKTPEISEISRETSMWAGSQEEESPEGLYEYCVVSIVSIVGTYSRYV